MSIFGTLSYFCIMKQPNQLLKRMERNAVLVVLMTVFICLLVNFLLQRHHDSSNIDALILQDTVSLVSESSKQKVKFNDRHEEKHIIAYSTQSKTRPEKTAITDINSATKEQLMQLPGIGAVLSERIIKYRDLLGGFYKPEQLKEVYGITAETFDKVAPLLTLSSGKIKVINPNTATLEALNMHPYISEKLARQIVNYREKVKKFQQISDMSALYEMDNSTLEKLTPYLKIE